MKNQKLGLLALLLALLMSLSILFVACKDDEEPTPPPEESGEEESGLPELVPVPTTPVEVDAGTLRIAFADGSATSAPASTYTVRISPDLAGTGTLVLTVAQGENANIAVSGTDDSDDAETTVTKAIGETELQASYDVTVSGVEVGDFTLSAAYTLTGTTEAGAVATQALSVRHTLSVSPQDILALQGGVRTLTATASMADATVQWAVDGTAVTLGDQTGASVTANLVATGSATVTASYSYTPYGAAEAVTVSDSVDVTVSERLATVPSVISDDDLLAFADFDFDEGTTLDLQTSKTGITATYSTNSTQSTTAKTGKAFEVTQNSGGIDTAPGVTLSGLSDQNLATDGLTVSFWYYSTAGEDWNNIIRSGTSRITFLNLCSANGNLWPNGGDNNALGGVLEAGYAWDSISQAATAKNTWLYISVTVSSTDIKFYLDGNLICTYSQERDAKVGTICSQILGASSLILFGNNEGTASIIIDELLVTKGLGASEITALYNAVNPSTDA